MKGNKMSAILAILLMLSGALFAVPRTFAVPPLADAITANPLSISWQYPAHGPGETFTVYADVVNVQQLFAFQLGFYFDNTALKVLSVSEGGFLSNNGADMLLAFPGSISNALGVVKSYGWTLTDPALAKTGSGHLMTVQMQILSTLSPPYTDGAPGGPVTMMHFTEQAGDQAQLKLIWSDGATIISPLPQNLHDGSFTLFVLPHNPTALFTVSPIPPNYVGDLLTFDGTTSSPGWNGYANVPIVNYQWDFGDGNITNTPGPTVTHSYGLSGGYTITLVVTDADGRVSAPYSAGVNMLVRPTGCVLDVFTQGWRYLDPYTIQGVLQGKGPSLPAALFRPGDLVQLFVTTVYNGDPVAAQIVAYEVYDSAHNVWLTGQAVTNTLGLAELDFRVPWPQDVNNPGAIFGPWTVKVTWEIGSNSGLPPFAKTQMDNMTFNVGWGIWSSDFATDQAGYFKGDTVTVTYKLHNDYGVDVNVLSTVTLYDDLMVPIGFNKVEQIFHAGVTPVSLAIVIPPWAYVGVGTAKGDEFSTWPENWGVVTAPEQLATFAIKHTFSPQDP